MEIQAQIIGHQLRDRTWRRWNDDSVADTDYNYANE
jgi:hypothetical protein